MSTYNIYPAVDENYNFPPQIRQSIVSYPEIQDAQARMTEAEERLVENSQQLDAARLEVALAEEKLRILEEQKLPEAVERLEAADAAAAIELEELDTNLATAKQELEATEASINTLKNDTLPTMRQELDAADAAALAELGTLDTNLATAKQDLEATEASINTLKNETLPTLQQELDAAAAQAQQDFEELEGRLSSIDTPDSGALAQMRKDLTAAETVADNARTSAEAANTAASAASQAALEAAGIAASKGSVLIQEDEPQGEDRRSSNIWIKPIPDDPDTEIEEKAITYVYLEDSDEWITTSSDELAQAAQNALDAREAAQQAQQRADTAISNAATAQSAAEAAQRTADEATTDARDAWNEAISATERARAAIERGDSLIANGSFELGDANWPSTPGRQEIVESATARSGSHVMRLTPFTANAYPLPDAIAVGAGRVFRARMWAKYLGGNKDSRLSLYYRLFDRTGAQLFASYAGFPVRVYVFSEDMPLDTWVLIEGDISLDSDVTNPDLVTHMTVAPHALRSSTDTFDIDDLQLIDITEAYLARARADEAMAEAESKLDEDQVQAIADEAETRLNTKIVASANGKNSITRSTAPASGDGVVEGDAWYQVDSAGDAFAMWYWDGDDWVPSKVRNEMIDTLDVNKVVGGEGDFEEFFAQNLTANDAAVNNLWVDGLSAYSINASRLVVTTPDNLFPGVSGWDKGRPYPSSIDPWVNFGLNTSHPAVHIQGRSSARMTQPVSFKAGTRYRFEVGVSASVINTRFYWEFMSDAEGGGRAVTFSDVSGVTTSGYAMSGPTLTNGGVNTFWGEGVANETVEGYLLVHANHSNGADNSSGYQWFHNPTVRAMTGAVLIEDGAVNADKVNAESVGAAVGKFVEAEVGNLKATTGTIGEAVIDKLWTDGLVSKTAAFNSVTVATGNLIPDPQMQNPELTANRQSSSTAGWRPDAITGTYWLNTDASGSQAIHLHGLDSRYETSELEPGQQYAYSFEVSLDSGMSINTRMAVSVTRQNGSLTYVGGGSYRTITYSSGWTRFEGIWTAQSDAVKGSFSVQINGLTGSGTVRVRNPIVRPMVGSVLIEDGAVNAEKVNAESVAGAVGQFVEAEVGNLKATEGTIGSAVINKLWADGIASKSLTTSQITVSPSNMLAGVQSWGLSNIDRDVDPWQSFGRNSGDPSRWARGLSTYLVTQPIEFVKGQKYRLTFDIKGQISGTRFYLQLTNSDMDGNETSGSFYVYADDSSSRTSYLFSNRYAGNNVFHPVSVEFEPEVSGLAMFKWYMNHSNGTSTSTTYQWIRGPELRPMMGTTVIEDGAISTDKLNVTGTMSAKIAEFLSLKTKEMIVTDGATINNAKLIGDTWAENITASKIIGNNGLFTGTVDANKINAGSFAGKSFTGGTFTGSRVNSVDSHGFGLILEPQATKNNASLVFTDNGGTAFSQAAVWRNGYGVGVPTELMLKGAHGADVRIQDDLYVNKIMKAQNIESRANLLVDGNTNINRNLYVGGRAAGPNSGSIFTSGLDTDGIYLRGTAEMTTHGSSRIQHYGRLDQHGSSVYFHNLPSSSSSGNMVLSNTSRRAHQNFSTRRVKSDIQDWEPTPEQVLALQPRQWIHDDPNNDPEDNGEHAVGFVAEEVEEAGLVDLVVYDADGLPQSLSYDRFSAAQQVVLKKHEKEISELRAENEELRSRLDRLEALLESHITE